ncbi:MAG: hypothetical protein ACLS2V_01925 [Clostridium paraputrificum]|uniref:hypothetical protein n=1 Tax=Clostridium paraputrificum TaxID=29363 RepID=UPI0018A04902|nr:hypothetical protein [Clostridium paraputrificum]
MFNGLSKYELNALKHALGTSIKRKQNTVDICDSIGDIDTSRILSRDLKTEKNLYKKVKVELDRYYVGGSNNGK